MTLELFDPASLTPAAALLFWSVLGLLFWALAFPIVFKKLPATARANEYRPQGLRMPSRP